MQHAVNPVTYAELLGHGFQVNIRRAVAEGFHDDQADQLDDWRVGLGDVFIRHQLVFDFVRQGQGAFGDFRQHGFHRAGCPPVVVGDGLLDFLWRRHHAFHVGLEHVAQAVERIHVQRIAQGHGQDVFIFENRDNLVALGHVAGDHVENFAGDIQPGQGDSFHTELGGQRLEDIELVHHALAGQHIHDPLVVLGGQLARGDRLLPRDQPDILQYFQDIIVVRSQGDAPSSFWPARKPALRY